MSQPVIQVRDLGKLYRIRSTERSPYSTFREDMVNGIKRFVRGDFGNSQSEDFWALKDVSFDVHQGEVVGIIGRNGAGKSTLLKILSRIVQPTTGEAIIRGRVGSLLEVGTGFHPELTGRENIFMNGAVLGMKRAEIKKQFDAIVDFAEVEKFLDTPVKFYSSGMYVRLAFAVAAHLEPEILIVDEVLAVGDAAFQKKCLGKMGEVSEKDGRTVLFVSHNMKAITSLCSRVIVLENRTITENTTPEKGVFAYMNSLHKLTANANTNLKDRLNRTSGSVRFTQIRLQDENKEEKWTFPEGEPIYIQVNYQVFKEVPSLGFYIALKDSIQDTVLTNCRHILSSKTIADTNTIFEAIIKIDNSYIRAGTYSLYLWLGDQEFVHPFDVVDENISLPYLLITNDTMDQYQQLGYFSIKSELIRA